MNIAECLALGKAVVATGYGGCMDFMNEANALVVPHVLRPVEPGEYLHGDGQEWAEPDLDVAAELLRKAFEGGAAIDALRQAGRKMAETHSFEMIGRKMAARIGEIEKRFS
jgi:glycosyltransferase involved in cell wall biosynthesis